MATDLVARGLAQTANVGLTTLNASNITNDSLVSGAKVDDAFDTLKGQVDALTVNSNATIGVYDLTAAGTVNAITATYTNLTYFTYLKILVATTGVNTGAATININSLGVKNIRIKGSDGVKVALAGGEIPPYALMEYDGTDFVLLNSRTGETSVTSTVTQNITSLPVYAEGQLKATVKGNVVANLLGNVGDCESTSSFTVTQGSLTLDSSNKVFGSNGIKLTQTTLGTGCATGVNVISRLESSKYYFLSGFVKNSNYTSGIYLYVRSNTNGLPVTTGAYGLTASIYSGTSFTRQGLVFSGSSFGSDTYIFVGVAAFGSQNQLGYFDGLQLIEITQSEFNAGETAMLAKYAWHNDIADSDRMRVVSVGKNLVNNLTPINYITPSTSDSYSFDTFTNIISVTDLSGWGRPVFYTQNYIQVTQGETLFYKINSGTSKDNLYVRLFTEKKENLTNLTLSGWTFNSTYNAYIKEAINGATITIPANVFYIRVGGHGGGTFGDLQLERNSTATTYEPYTETSAIVPVALNNVSSTIKDTFDANTGVHTKNVSDVVTLSGLVGSWALGGDINLGTTTKYFFLSSISGASSGVANNAICYKYNNKALTTLTVFNKDTGDALWFPASSPFVGVITNNVDTGFLDAWNGTTSFTGLTWANLIKAYMNGWKLTTANTNVDSCVWTGIASGTTQSGSSGYTTVTTTVDTGYQPYRLIYQLATPVVTNYLPNVLNAEQSGTIYVEPFIEDVALYGSNITIENSAYPIDSLSYVYRINVANGALTPIALSSCTIASNKLSFTITGAAVNEYYLYGYTYSGLSTVPDLTYSYTAEIQEQLKVLDQKIETLNAIEKKRMMTAPVALGSISATTTQICFIAPASCAIQSFQLCNGGAIAASNTDYWTFALVDKGSDGTASNTIVTKSTQVTGGQAIAAYDAYDLGTMDMTHRVLAEGDVVVLTITKTGSATALTEARGILRYTLL